jgi:hypothetical protein
MASTPLDKSKLLCNFKQMIAMKAPSAIFLCLSFLLLVACSKDPVEKVEPEKTYTFFPRIRVTDPNNEVEVIVSTASGKVLFDSVVFSNIDASVKFSSNEKRFNFTYISYSVSERKYLAVTYRSVDPTNWDTLSPWFGYRMPPIYFESTPFTSGRLTLTNTPTGSPYFSCYVGSSSTAIGGIGSNTLVVSYQRRNGLPVFINFPKEGLHKVFTPTSDNETVDLSQLAKSVKLPWGFPAGFAPLTAFAHGLIDTTNIEKTLRLAGAPDPDFLIYPPTGFQKYSWASSAENKLTGEKILHYSFGDSIVRPGNFLTKDNFELSSSTDTDFRIRFVGQKPYMYVSEWEDTELNWIIYSPADSGSIQPLTMLKGWKPKRLSNTTINSLRLKRIFMERSEQNSFDDAMSRFHVSAVRNKPRYLVINRYEKSF